MSEAAERSAGADEAPDVEATEPDTALVDVAEAPALAGEDVRAGPEFTDTPQAGGTEPSD